MDFFRYDVRGYLHDLKQYEPTPGLQFEEPDLEEEKLCDEERYRSLQSDMSEEQLYQGKCSMNCVTFSNKVCKYMSFHFMVIVLFHVYIFLSLSTVI